MVLPLEDLEIFLPSLSVNKGKVKAKVLFSGWML